MYHAVTCTSQERTKKVACIMQSRVRARKATIYLPLYVYVYVPVFHGHSLGPSYYVPRYMIVRMYSVRANYVS